MTEATPAATPAPAEAAAEEKPEMTAAESADEQASKDWAEFDTADRTGEPVVEPEPKPEPTAEPAAKPAAAEPAAAKKDDPPAPDIWAGASPEQLAERDALTQKYNVATTEMNRAHGTVGGLQKKINQLETRPPTEEPAGGDVDDPEAAEMFGSDAYKQVKDDYPEVMEPIEAAFKTLEGRIDKVSEQVGGLEVHRTEAVIGEQHGLVLGVHADYDTLAGSPEFRNWFATSTLPQYVRNVVQENSENIVDGAAVVDIVNRFKTETGYKPPTPTPAPKEEAKPDAKPDPKREAQLDSATAPKTKSIPAASHPEPPENDQQAQWEWAERLDAQKAEAEANR